MPTPAAREVAVTILHPREIIDARSHRITRAAEPDTTPVNVDLETVDDPGILAEIDLIDALKGMYFCG